MKYEKKVNQIVAILEGMKSEDHYLPSKNINQASIPSSELERAAKEILSKLGINKPTGKGWKGRKGKADWQEPQQEKGIFNLKTDYTIPTNTSMRECHACTEAGTQHVIEDKDGPPARGNEVSIKGSPTTIRVCSGCGRWDGPWVPAPW